jgi:hypothetical protein
MYATWWSANMRGNRRYPMRGNTPMTDAHDQVTKLWNLALADSAFPEEYMELKTTHPAIEFFLAHNAETAARSWATSLQAQVREIGWRLYAKGGIDAMIAAADTMHGWGSYPPDLAEFVRRVGTVWNGIGFADDPRGIYKLADESED